MSIIHRQLILLFNKKKFNFVGKKIFERLKLKIEYFISIKLLFKLKMYLNSITLNS